MATSREGERLRALGIGFVLALALITPSAPPVTAAITAPFSASIQRPVAPGVEHRRGGVTGSAGVAEVNVVAVNRSESVSLENTLAFDRVNAREQPTLQGLRHSSEGHRVVATINGSNFSAPEGLGFNAIGLHITDGELASAGYRRAGEQLVAFGLLDDGQAIVGAPTLSITATLPDGSSAPIARVNQRVQGDDSSLFTPRYDTSTRTLAPDIEVTLSGVELPLRASGSFSGTVSDVRLGVGDSPLAEDTLVISAAGTAALPFAGLQLGDSVTLTLSIDAPWDRAVLATGGREVLMRDGLIDIFPVGGQTFNSAQPRSAVGVTAAGELLMVTVDGRQSHSAGVSIPEMAELMRDLGAVDAINLDGGGSTVLSARTPGNVEAVIVNKPSGGIERTVSNALHVISATPTGPLAGVAILPETSTLLEGQSRQLQLMGYDEAYNGIQPDLGPIEWSTTGEAASVDASGWLTAVAPGLTTVQASAGGWSATLDLEVKRDLGVLTVAPPQVAFVPEITSGKKAVQLQVGWEASNPKAAVTLIEVQARINSGPWAAVPLPEPAPMGIVRAFKFGALHQLRVRATDAHGNRSAWVVGSPFRLIAYEVTSPEITWSGRWTVVSSTKAIGGRFVRTDEIGASLSLAAWGDHTAVVGHRRPIGGSADMGYLDGAASSVSTYAPALVRRAVLWVGAAPENGEGLDGVIITNTSPASPSRLEIDALIVLRLGG